MAIGAPLVLTTGRAIRALCIAFPEPKGVAVSPAHRRHLARRCRRHPRAARRSADAPAARDGAFNASALQRPRFGPFWTRNTLLIGYPLLATLTPEQARAVVAHELGHITHAHGWFAAWVHRTRASWVHLIDALDRDGTTPVYAHLLFRWYVPRLQAAAAAVSRRQELLADRLAAEVTGSDTAAQALVAIEIGGHVLDRMFWPRVFDRVRHDPDPPRPYSEMGPEIWAHLDDRCRPPGRGPTTRDAAIRHASKPAGTPCGAPSARADARASRIHRGRPVSRMRQAERSRLHSIRTGTRPLASGWTPPAPGATRPRSNDWHSSPRRPRRLLSRRSNGRSSRNSEGNEQEALDLYTSAHARGHITAALAAGRLLLLRNDPTGVALIDAAMSADPMLVEDGCSAIVEFLNVRADSSTPTRTRSGRADRRRSTGWPRRSGRRSPATDSFSAGSHPELDVAALARALASERAVQRAWLAAKALAAFGRHADGVGRADEGRAPTRPRGTAPSGLRVCPKT